MARGRFPIGYGDVLAARDRIRPFLPVTPLREYAELESEQSQHTSFFEKIVNYFS